MSIRPLTAAGVLVANTLGDLTRRENQFAHCSVANVNKNGNNVDFPYDACRWGQLGLPTLHECSAPGYNLAAAPFGAVPAAAKTHLDFWAKATSTDPTSALPWPDNVLLSGGNRVADNVILNNVIGFDVKAWDPVVVVQETNTTTGVISYVFPADPAYAAAYANVGSKVGNIVYALAPQYRDLGFANAAYAPANSSSFGHTGRPVGYVLDTATNTYIQKNLPCVYDTWSTHYEATGTCPNDPRAGRAINGTDDPIVELSQPANGLVDDDAEKLTSPPIRFPCGGFR